MFCSSDDQIVWHKAKVAAVRRVVTIVSQYEIGCLPIILVNLLNAFYQDIVAAIQCVEEDNVTFLKLPKPWETMRSPIILFIQ